MRDLRAYIGRANVTRLELQQDGSTVPESAVTRAVLRVGDTPVDTDVGGDPIELTDNATVVELQLGLIDGLTAGRHPWRLTVFDAAYPEGIAWDVGVLHAEGWPVS